MTLALVEMDGIFNGSIEYDVDLFAPATIDRMIARLRVLLEAVVSDPGRRVDDIPLLLPGELAEIDGWNPAPVAFADGAIHELFRIRAAKTPDAVAIVGGRSDLDLRRPRHAERPAGATVG